MKKLVALILAFCMAFALCACGQSEAPAAAPAEEKAAEEVEAASDPIKIGICFTTWTSNPIFIDARKKLHELADQNGWELYEKDLTPDTVINSLETFINAGCDVIIVQANQAPDAVASMFPQFEEAGITLGIFDTDQFKDEACVAYTATNDNYAGGYTIGKYAAEWAKEHIDGKVYAGVTTYECNEVFKYRPYGIMDGLKDNLDPDMLEIATVEVSVNGDNVQNIPEDALSMMPEMNIYCAWYGGAGVAGYETLKSLGWEGGIFSCDCSQDEVKAMMNNDLLIASINYDTGNEAVKLVQRTVEFVENGKQYPEGTTDADKCWAFPCIVVTQDMAPDYLD